MRQPIRCRIAYQFLTQKDKVMTTIAKRKIVKTLSRNNRPNIEQERQQISNQGTLKDIAVSQIDLSPFNYRRVFLPVDIQEFSNELLLHGIISPLTVRKMPSGRFELVVGERRLRAAKIAKLKTVPTRVRVLTDDEVREIQLAENMKRESPHPLYESQQVALLQQGGKSIDEVAVRLGKSKTWVYTRIKLSELIVPVQEVFLSEKISIQDAIDISALSPESQQEFFDTCCTNWQDEHFRIGNLKYQLSRLKYDLKKAPFDIKDKNLVPAAGACSRCPFNSATVKSLFPELAKEAICTHKSCYKSKCLANAELKIRSAISEQQPTAILYNGSISEESRMILDSLPEACALPEYSLGDVNVFKMPTEPDKEDFMEYENMNEDSDTTVLNDEEYNEAVQEYEIAVSEYKAALESESTFKGLCISLTDVGIVYFNLEKKAVITEKVTAKQVQEAIKSGTATVELLEKEVQRISERETRFKEIDQDKIQKEIHEKFKEQVLSFPEIVCSPTSADQTALRLIVFQALNWQMQRTVKENLLPGLEFHSREDKEAVYKALAGLTEEQFCFLIRAVLVGESQSQYPRNIYGYALYQCAEASGIEVTAICNAQAEIATVRQERQDSKIADLERKIKKLSDAA